MRQTVFTQQIAKSPEVVWAFISDLRNDCAWRQEVTDCELISGAPNGAPACYVETIAWEGLEAEIVLTVSESVRGSRVVISGEDQSYSSTGVWTLEPRGDGTLASLDFVMETKGAVHLVEPFMWGIVTRWLERDLPRLEDHL